MLHVSYYLIPSESLNFLKDILPVLISSFALLASVVTPYLLIRYEKISELNRGHREFLRKVELYFLEWLNISRYNSDLIDEILSVADPNIFILKDFQFYDFPPIDFLKTYNNELLNEFYVQIRKLKSLDHYLRKISIEFSVYKKDLMNRSSALPANGDNFFGSSFRELQKQYLKSLDDITKLRIKVRLLLNEIKQTDSLEVRRFFNFNQDKVCWYKKDFQFTDEEIRLEEAKLKKEKQERQKEEP